MGVVCLRTRYSLLVKKTFLQTDAEMCINISSWYSCEMKPPLVLQWPFFQKNDMLHSGQQQQDENSTKRHRRHVSSIIITLSSLSDVFKVMLCSSYAPRKPGRFFFFFFTPTDLLPSSLMFHKCWAEIKSLFESVPISLPPTYPFWANFSHSHHSVAVWRAGGKR